MPTDLITNCFFVFGFLLFFLPDFNSLFFLGFNPTGGLITVGGAYRTEAGRGAGSDPSDVACRTVDQGLPDPRGVRGQPRDTCSVRGAEQSAEAEKVVGYHT